MEETTHRRLERLTDPAVLAMAAFAVPLFIWSAFNADFFALSGESFIIPLAVFFGGPVAVAAAMWAYHRRDAYLATTAGLFGAFWLTYGTMLWLIDTGVIESTVAAGDARGLLFVGWAVTFGIIWAASARRHWTISLVALGSGLMFILLSIGYYADNTDALRAGGWVGFITAGLAWYGALAELLNSEFEEPVLPTEPEWFRRFRFGAR